MVSYSSSIWHRLSWGGILHFIGGALQSIGGWTERLISILARWLIIAGVVALAVSMCLTCVDVVLRYFLNRPLPGSMHLVEFLQVAIIALPLAYCQQTKAHIRVDLILGRLHRIPRAVMELLTTVAALILFGLVTWTGAEEAWRAIEIGAYVEALINYPLWPAKCLLFIGTGCLCLRLIIDVAQNARDVFKPQT